MGIETKGLDRALQHLEKVEKNLREVEGTQEVPASELFGAEFMRKYTRFNSLEEMLDTSGFKIDSPEWNGFVSVNTPFASWQEMIKKAGEEYLVRKVGF